MEKEEMIKRLKIFALMDEDIKSENVQEISELLNSIDNIVKSRTMVSKEQKSIKGFLYQLGSKLSYAADLVPADWSILKRMTNHEKKPSKEDLLRMKLLALSNRTFEITRILTKMGDKE